MANVVIDAITQSITETCGRRLWAGAKVPRGVIF